MGIVGANTSEGRSHGLRILADGSLLVFSNVLIAAIGYAASVIVARQLQPLQYGVLMTATSFVGAFGVLIDLGLSNVLIRKAVREQVAPTMLLSHFSGLRLAAAGTVTVLVALLAIVTTYNLEVRLLIAFLALTLVFASISSYYGLGLVLGGKLWRLILVRSCERLAYVFLLFPAFQFLSPNAGLVATAMVIASIATVGVAVFVTPKSLAPRWNLHLHFDRDVLRPGFVFLLAGVLGVLYGSIDLLIISVLLGTQAVGEYAIVFTAFNLLNVGLSAFLIAALPLVVRRVSRRVPSGKAVVWQCLAAGAAVIPAAFCLSQVSAWFVSVIYGPAYLPAARYLSTVAWAIPLIVATVPVTLVIDATGSQRVHLWNGAIVASVNIALDFLLIPLWGLMGVAISTLIARGVGLIIGIPLALWIVRKTISTKE